MESPLLKENNYQCNGKTKKGLPIHKIENQVQGRNDNAVPTTFLFFVLILGCVGLACWNVYLSIELARVRHDVDALAKEFRDYDIDDSESFSSVQYETYKDNEESNEKGEDESTQLFSPRIKKDKLKDQTNAATDHSLVKRSNPSARLSSSRGEKGRKGGRKGGKNGVKKRLRNHKAVAIHIQGKQSLSDLEHPINTQVAGRKLTGWMQPSKRYVGFDSTPLQSDGYVTVPSDGLYFVYSQVVFRTSDVPYMVAEIGVKSMGAQTFTKCQFSRQNNATTGSYVACHSNGVVFLRRGEGLSLMVSPSNVHVYMSPQHTYFGAFLVGLA